MTADKSSVDRKKSDQPDRKDRLAQALRDNLKRRKQQARTRAEDASRDTEDTADKD